MALHICIYKEFRRIRNQKKNSNFFWIGSACFSLEWIKSFGLKVVGRAQMCLKGDKYDAVILIWTKTILVLKFEWITTSLIYLFF